MSAGTLMMSANLMQRKKQARRRYPHRLLGRGQFEATIETTAVATAIAYASFVSGSPYSKQGQKPCRQRQLSNQQPYNRPS